MMYMESIAEKNNQQNNGVVPVSNAAIVKATPKKIAGPPGYCRLIDFIEYMQFGSELAEAEQGNAGRNPVGAYFNQGVCMIPHFQKRYRGGEDAYVSRDDLIVVADGVGGWANSGIDSGLYSRELVKFIEQEFVKNKALSLKQMLINAAIRNYQIGSSTAVMAKF